MVEMPWIREPVKLKALSGGQGGDMQFKDFVKASRKKTNLTQVKFAILIKVSVDTLRAWEVRDLKIPHENIIRDHIERVVGEVTGV